MKRIDNKLLFELIRNSKKSDRELAKVLGVSQPTVTRTRRRLEKESKIREYTAILDWANMGYEIAAFTFVDISSDAEIVNKAEEWTRKRHEIVFASGGEGMGMNSVMVSLHKDYTSFLDFISEFRRQWADIVKEVSSFVVSLRAKDPLIAKSFSFKYLGET